MLTPLPYDMKLIIMGSNQVAFDAICCQIIGIRPVRWSISGSLIERGFGPVDLSQIDITGDVSLDQAREQARGFR